MLSHIKNNLVTFILYYLVTFLVLSLMYEPSQAILVWPAVGVGIIAALVWGISVLPALYLAQLIINLQLSGKGLAELSINDWTLTHLLLGAGLIRCYLGAFLIKYFVGYPNALVSNKSILNFFFIAGPITALVSTAIYNTIQFSWGFIDLQSLPERFFDWWFGDVLGFIIFAPLTMTLICQPKSIWKERQTTLGIPVIIIFLGVVFLFNRTQIVENINISQNLSIKTELIASKLDHKISKTQQFISQLKTRFNNSSLSELRKFLSNSQLVDALIWKIDNGVEYTSSLDSYNPIDFVRLKQTNFESVFANNQLTADLMSKTLYISNIDAFANRYYLKNAQRSVTVIVINDFNEYLNSLLDQFDLTNINFKLSISDNSNPFVLIDSGQVESHNSKVTSVSSKLVFFQEDWEISLVPTTKYLALHQIQSNSLIAKISLLFTGLIGIMLLVITGKATLTDIEVKERTFELDIKAQKVKESKEQYQKLVEQHPVILWRLNVDQGKMVYISSKVQRLYGHPHQSWLSRNDFWIKNIHPDDQDKVRESIKQALKDHQHFELEYRLIRSDRSIAWINDVINVITKNDKVIELVGLMIDISETIEAKERQDISENRYKTLFKYAVDPFIVMNPTTKNFIDANDKAIKLFGLGNDFRQFKLSNFVPEKQPDGTPSERLLFKFFNTAKMSHNIKFVIQMINGQKKAITCEINLVKLPGKDKDLFLVSINDITLKRLHEKKINHLAYYDNLTNLPNREYFYTKFDFYYKKAKSTGSFGTIIYLDLDRFKILNDSLGHQAGDKLLKMVAQRIQKIIGNKDFCARLGGDEFVVLTKKFDANIQTALESSLVKSELILEALNEPYFIGDYEHLITPSIGISVFPSKDASIDEIIHQADIAMYSSKEKGKNTITVYRDTMDRLVSQRLEFEKGIRLAFENHEFELYYQPQVNEENQIEAVEALLRWEKLRSYNKNTEELIETIEEIGLTHELRHWVFDEACSKLKKWQEENRPVHSIAINVSAKQFHQNFFIEQVKSVIESYQLQPSQIVLELTEQAIIEDVDGLIYKLSILKDYGVRTSLDDFGTGYSSLAYLKQLPIHQLKIDKMFIKDMNENENSQHIVKTIINLAQMMEIELVAEGIETDVHYGLLKGLGCKQFQGYYFSRPLPESELFKAKNPYKI